MHGSLIAQSPHILLRQANHWIGVMRGTNGLVLVIMRGRSVRGRGLFMLDRSRWKMLRLSGISLLLLLLPLTLLLLVEGTRSWRLTLLRLLLLPLLLVLRLLQRALWLLLLPLLVLWQRRLTQLLLLLLLLVRRHLRLALLLRLLPRLVLQWRLLAWRLILLEQRPFPRQMCLLCVGGWREDSIWKPRCRDC